jgi:ribosome-binding factor A
VHVSPDSRHATIKVALHGEDRQKNQALAALDHASGYLRRELASRLRLRHVPELHFEPDKNPDADSRIDFLLRRAKKSRSREEKQP